MTDEFKRLVEDAEARASKATPGPWETDGGRVVVTATPIDDEDAVDVCEVLHRGNDAGAFGDHTAQFIAHARQDVPALCAAVRELDAEVSEARETALRMIRTVAPEVADRNKDASLDYLLGIVSAGLAGAMARKP